MGRLSVLPSPETRWPLMKFVVVQSLISAELASLLGYLLPPGPCCFQQDGGFSSAPAPVHLRVRVHPLINLTSPTEYVTAPNLACR
jgi:hypothetical protein